MPSCTCGDNHKQHGFVTMNLIVAAGHPAWRKMSVYKCPKCGREKRVKVK